MVKQKTYPNGLRMIVKQLDGVFSVSAGILVGAGSRLETPQNNGISHFIEHMMFKGTEKLTPFEISDAIDSIGGQINAFTTKETTCYYTKSTAEHTEKAVSVLSDIFFNSVFDEKEMDKERGVIIEEINMNEDTPDDLCFDLLASAHFGETGLGATILGPIENIERFTRKDITDYMSAYYHPQNIVVCFAGKISFEQAEELVEKYFVHNFKSTPFVKPQPTHSFVFGKTAKKKDIEQAHLCLAYTACPYGSAQTDYYSLFNSALGGGMSSVLFQKVREELGLAYSVYSYISTYADCGTLGVYAGVNPKNKDVAYECILDEISKLKNRGLTEAEFLRAKEQIKGSFVFSQESNASQMLLYSKYLLYKNEIFSFEDKIKTINSITMDSLNKFIAEEIDIVNFSEAIVSKEI